MPHPDWCGNPCAECDTGCVLDASMQCSPDCEDLDPCTGKPGKISCKFCERLHDYGNSPEALEEKSEDKDAIANLTDSYLQCLARVLGIPEEKITSEVMENVTGFVIPYLEDLRLADEGPAAPLHLVKDGDGDL